MTREIEIRLVGHRSDEGEVLATDLLALVGAFRELIYRLTRAVAEGPGLGRTNGVLEALAAVRVALPRTGTRLTFRVGDATALVDPVAAGVDLVLHEIVGALPVGERPASVPDPVAETVDDLIVAMQRAAPVVTLTLPGRPPRSLDTALISRAPWRRRVRGGSDAEVRGVLEMVDLRSARFRLREPTGTPIDLIDVTDAGSAAHLVGARVVVTGVLVVGSGTTHHRMERAFVEAQDPVPHDQAGPVQLVLPGTAVSSVGPSLGAASLDAASLDAASFAAPTLGTPHLDTPYLGTAFLESPDVEAPGSDAPHLDLDAQAG